MLNKFISIILSRPGEEFHETVLIYHYEKLSSEFSNAVIVGVGTGKVHDSWFSFDMNDSETPYNALRDFVAELELKSNNKGKWLKLLIIIKKIKLCLDISYYKNY